MDEPEEPTNTEEGIDRRGFVKACVGAAVVGAGGAAGFGMFRQVTDVGDHVVRNIGYWGAKRSDKSPAPRGLALIPVAVDGSGFIGGVPDHLDWYRYCGHELAPGLSDVDYTTDETFRYSLPQDKLHIADPEGTYWYHGLLDQPMHVDHFRDRPYGTGAAVRWRSEGLRGDDIITALP